MALKYPSARKGRTIFTPVPPTGWTTATAVTTWKTSSARSAALYGYGEVRTPVFEATDLFKRSIGEGTDIVSKEMYTFVTKGGDSLTLRPESTAPVLRAYRPELALRAGRRHQALLLRQPTSATSAPRRAATGSTSSLGVEALGTDDPALDAEVIGLALAFFRRVGIRNLTLKLNSVGSFESRADLSGRPESLRRAVSDRVQRRRPGPLRDQSPAPAGHQKPARTGNPVRRPDALRLPGRRRADAPRGADRLSDRRRRGLSARPVPGARLRLLHQDRFRDPVAGPGRAERAGGWGTLQQTGRGDRRPADARHRLRAGRRARPDRPAVAGRRDARRPRARWPTSSSRARPPGRVGDQTAGRPARGRHLRRDGVRRAQHQGPDEGRRPRPRPLRPDSGRRRDRAGRHPAQEPARRLAAHTSPWPKPSSGWKAAAAAPRR